MTETKGKGLVLSYFLQKYYWQHPDLHKQLELDVYAAALGVTPKEYLRYMDPQAYIPDPLLCNALRIIGITKEDFDFHVTRVIKLF